MYNKIMDYNELIIDKSKKNKKSLEQYNKEYREQNKKKLKEYRHEYYEKNKYKALQAQYKDKII
jgi:hypothetical protein